MNVEIEPEIRKFIAENFLLSSDRTELSEVESLLDAGLIDSTGVLDLVAFLETRFKIQVNDAEIVPENLDSIGAIVAYIESKFSGT